MEKNNILITGVSSGIGLELLKSSLKKNFNVIGISRKKPKILSSAKRFKHIKFDLNNFAEYDRVFGQIYQHFGKINYFVHAAGVHDLLPINLINEKSYEKIMNINLKSPTLISKFFDVRLRRDSLKAVHFLCA